MRFVILFAATDQGYALALADRLDGEPTAVLLEQGQGAVSINRTFPRVAVWSAAAAAMGLGDAFRAALADGARMGVCLVRDGVAAPIGRAIQSHGDLDQDAAAIRVALRGQPTPALRDAPPTNVKAAAPALDLRRTWLKGFAASLVATLVALGMAAVWARLV